MPNFWCSIRYQIGLFPQGDPAGFAGYEGQSLKVCDSPCEISELDLYNPGSALYYRQPIALTSFISKGVSLAQSMAFWG